jgi:DNA-binding response OmpR family regulator
MKVLILESDGRLSHAALDSIADAGFETRVVQQDLQVFHALGASDWDVVALCGEIRSTIRVRVKLACEDARVRPVVIDALSVAELVAALERLRRQRAA